MAVIISNMDMPKSCDECPISRYQELHDCPILRMFTTKHSEKRLDECPLKSADEMIAEIEDYNVRKNFEGCTTEYMLGVARGLDLSATIAHKYCDKGE